MTEHSLVHPQIKVKCPAVFNSATKDITLSMAKDWTVKDLKENLEKKHPCQPKAEDQRLIFQGRILNDILTIAQMCEIAKSNELVIHMVLSSGNYHQQRGSLSTPEMADKPFTLERGGLPIAPTAGTSNIPPVPQGTNRPSGPAYYGIVNDQGQVVYTDISNAVLFDGRQFYVMQGASVPVMPGSISNIARGGAAFMPLTMATSFSATRAAPQRPPMNQPAPPFFRRLNLDFAAISSFILRFGIVILIFAQGGGILKMTILTMILLFIFMAQAGLISFGGAHTILRALWEPIMRARRPVGREADADAVNPNADADANLDAPNRQPLPNNPAGNPLYKLFEVLTTFWLSLFPAEPPHIPDPNFNADPNNHQQNQRGQLPRPHREPIVR